MPKRTLTLVVLSGIAILALTWSGCADTIVEQTSGTSESGGGPVTEHTLEFDIDPPFPVAVDTVATYGVSTPRTDEVFESFSIDPQSEVVEVTSKTLEPRDNPSFSLRASQTGVYPVRLRAELSTGRAVERTFEMDVREVAGVEFDPQGHEPSEKNRHVAYPYIVDSEAHVSYTLVGSNGEFLAGTGRRPVEWEPTGALELDPEASEGTRMVFDTGSNPGVVTLRSTIGSEEQKIELITPSMVDDIVLGERARGLAVSDVELPLEGLWAAHIVPVYDGVTILDSSIDASLSSETSDVCEVVSDDRSTYEQNTGREVGSAIAESWPGDGFVVDIRGSGDCRLNAEFSEGNGGTGAEAQMSLQIAE